MGPRRPSRRGKLREGCFVLQVKEGSEVFGVTAKVQRTSAWPIQFVDRPQLALAQSLSFCRCVAPTRWA